MAIEAMESMMTPEQIHRARSMAETEVLSIRLAELREHRGLKQRNIGTFSQTSISKLEKRKDMKVSTLIEYLDGLGMGIEIRAVPKDKAEGDTEKILLRV